MLPPRSESKAVDRPIKQKGSRVVVGRVVSMWQMSHVKWHFPFAFTPVQEKAKHVADGWMAEPQIYCIAFSFGEMEKSRRASDYLQKTTRDGAAEFQAPRMINGFTNPVGLQTQMRTELIAVRNTLAWMERKCRRAVAKKRPSCRSELLLGFCLQEFTRCP